MRGFIGEGTGFGLIKREDEEVFKEREKMLVQLQKGKAGKTCRKKPKFKIPTPRHSLSNMRVNTNQ